MNSARPPHNMANLGGSFQFDDELLSEEQLAMVAGGSAIEDVEGQLEKLNPQTEVGKALQKSLETLIKGAESKLQEEI